MKQEVKWSLGDPVASSGEIILWARDYPLIFPHHCTETHKNPAGTKEQSIAKKELGKENPSKIRISL